MTIVDDPGSGQSEDDDQNEEESAVLEEGRATELAAMRLAFFAEPPHDDSSKSQYKPSRFRDPNKWGIRYGPMIGVVCLVFWVVVLIVSCVAPFIEKTKDIFLLCMFVCCGMVSIVCLAITNVTDAGTIHAKASLGNSGYLVSLEKTRRCNDENTPVEEGLLEQIDKVTSMPNNSKERVVTLRDGNSITQRWCVTCKIWKPPQSSHCRTCNKCVYRFDHHCGVVGNCVAFANHRFFASFLLLVTIAWICGFFLGIGRLIDVELFKKPREGFKHPEVYPILLFLLLSLCNFPCVASFACFHLSMVISNRTTYEQILKKRGVRQQRTKCWTAWNNVWKACFAPVRWRDPWTPFFASNKKDEPASRKQAKRRSSRSLSNRPDHGRSVEYYVKEKDNAEAAELRVLVAEEKYKESLGDKEPPGNTPPPERVEVPLEENNKPTDTQVTKTSQVVVSTNDSTLPPPSSRHTSGYGSV